MALINCPDCSNQVSDKAPTCPKCGRQIAATTIEKTGKSIKATQMLSMFGFVGGLLMIFAAKSMWGVLFVFVSGIAYVCAGLVRWWRHD